MYLSQPAFEALVEQAVDGLPDWVHAHLDNVVILVQPEAGAEERRVRGTGPGYDLLGLYEGVPLTQRGRGYQLVPPDRITLFQHPLERQAAREGSAASHEALVQVIRRTIIHEIAHHFGFSEEHLRDLGC